jgi:hypothetical protein
MEEDFEEHPLCVVEVNENIRRVQSGEPLTRSLSVLNANCDFRKKYNEIDNITHPIKRCQQCRKEIMSIGYCSDACRLKRKKYSIKRNQDNKNPEHRAYMRTYLKTYCQRPEVKERIKRYNEKPEVKERRRLYNQSEKRVAYMKIYNENRKLNKKLENKSQ